VVVVVVVVVVEWPRPELLSYCVLVAVAGGGVVVLVAWVVVGW
jgi:hypothetical protein